MLSTCIIKERCCLYAVQRRREILKIIQEKGFAPVSELSRLFGVSEVTIRTDLRFLKQEGKIERNYGGAGTVADDEYAESDGAPFSMVSKLLDENKTAIAKAAAGLISEGESIFLDASSTTCHLAVLLRMIHDITLISNSIPVFEQLKEYRYGTLIGVPGELNPVTQSFIGPYAENMIRSLKANKAFISPRAILPQGLRDASMAEASVKKMMMESADETIVLADHSKFGNRQALFGIGSFDRVAAIVTDKAPESEFAELFNKLGIRIIVAGEDI